MKLKNKSISREVATHHFYKREAMGFPDRSVSKESACSAGDPGSFPGLGRSLGEGKGYPLQYSGLDNSMDCIAHGVAKRRTRPTDLKKKKEMKENWISCQW